MNHQIPLGTSISFKGDSTVYKTADYQAIVGPCEPGCTLDHDCLTEPYIKVKEEIGTLKPISRLNHIFDPLTHYGRKITSLDIYGDSRK